MDDVEIVGLYWDRNQLAVTMSNIKYGQMLKRISFGILSSHEDSEECVNDTYMKAWNSMPTQRPTNLAAYLGRITRNSSINRLYEKHAIKRGDANLLLSELSECIPSAHSVEDEIETKELASLITKWLYSLSLDDRVLFLRRYWFGESLKRLADECLITPNKLAGRMFRLRKKLKSTLDKDGIIL